MSPPQRAVFTIWIFWTADTVQATFRAPETTGGLQRQRSVACGPPEPTQAPTHPLAPLISCREPRQDPRWRSRRATNIAVVASTASAPGRYTVPAFKAGSAAASCWRRAVAFAQGLRCGVGSRCWGQIRAVGRDAAGVVVEGGDQRGERHRMRGGGRETLSGEWVAGRGEPGRYRRRAAGLDGKEAGGGIRGRFGVGHPRRGDPSCAAGGPSRRSAVTPSATEIGRPEGRIFARSILWAGEDSNLRRRSRRVYSPFPLAARAPTQTGGHDTIAPDQTSPRPPGLNDHAHL